MLGEALRNLQKYVDKESFNNNQGQAQNLGPLQFDTKGVEFGPWLRRFVAQVRRNWFVPYAAMTFRGRVVLQFNIHKDGHITDIAVVAPSDINAFNLAANNAILGSNPTEPLPPEYPEPKAFFTVTFYYNEQPPN
jgi:TonB family protein